MFQEVKNLGLSKIVGLTITRAKTKEMWFLRAKDSSFHKLNQRGY